MQITFWGVKKLSKKLSLPIYLALEIDIYLFLVTEFEYITEDLCAFEFFPGGIEKMPVGGYTSKKLKGTLQKK